MLELLGQGWQQLRSPASAGVGSTQAPAAVGVRVGAPGSRRQRWLVCRGCAGKLSGCNQGCVGASISSVVTEEMLASPLLLLLLIAFIFLSSSNTKMQKPNQGCA